MRLIEQYATPDSPVMPLLHYPVSKRIVTSEEMRTALGTRPYTGSESAWKENWVVTKSQTDLSMRARYPCDCMEWRTTGELRYLKLHEAERASAT